MALAVRARSLATGLPRTLQLLLLSISIATAAVTISLDGAPPDVGDYPFPTHHSLVLANAYFTATFDRDDTTFTGWPGPVSISLTSLVVGGVDIALGKNLNGENPRDPDRQHSFYVDAGGGSSRLVCSTISVLRVEPDLVEVAFRDNTSTPLQHSHHFVVRSSVSGLYGFVHMRAVAATTISEVRMNARFDRGVLDYTYTDERGLGQQPTYAYLELMPKVQDETWAVNGSNAPSLPFPNSNGGNLPAGYVYTKYLWASE
jgi:rhamnogalacturonan endolyase